MPSLPEALQSQTYIRERIDPRPGDGFYIHLSDLKLALEQFRSDEKLTVLDYGCGGSPYRTFFPNATYLRADFSDYADLDFQIKETALPDVSNELCDLVWSTQVLEHVDDPSLYLSECFRVLKPGGRLVCSTHGMYEEHSCPHDFQRWTVAGLRKLMEQAGFAVTEVYRVSTGPRAMIFFNDLNYSSIRGPNTTLFGFFAAIFRFVYRKIRMHVHWQSDRFFAAHRVARESDTAHPLYLCVVADCRKPG